MKFLKKKKLIVMVAAGLSGISLGSVGFAGWVINATTAMEDQNVSVSFGDVTSRSYKAELVTAGTDLNLAFDSDGVAGTNGVVGSGQAEDLTFAIKFKITNMEKQTAGPEMFTNGMKSFSVEFSKYDVINSLITAGEMNLINSPVDLTQKQTISLANGNTSDNVSDTTKKTSATYKIEHEAVNGIIVTCTYTFGWGSTFSYVNPLQCENATNQTAGLKKLNELTTGKKVELGVKITPIYTAQ